jgi:hypothetical protein
VLEHLAVVLWQDLAVLHPYMSDHEVFGTSPFADDSFGFYTFRDQLVARIAASPSAKVEAEAEAARRRGDIQTASVLKVPGLQGAHGLAFWRA